MSIKNKISFYQTLLLFFFLFGCNQREDDDQLIVESALTGDAQLTFISNASQSPVPNLNVTVYLTRTDADNGQYPLIQNLFTDSTGTVIIKDLNHGGYYFKTNLVFGAFQITGGEVNEFIVRF